MSDPLSHGGGGEPAETVAADPTGDGVTDTIGGVTGSVADPAVPVAGGVTGGVTGGVVGGELSAAAAVAAAGADPLTITGRVRDSLGVALPRALVTLTGLDGGRRLAKTRSAEDGAFSLAAPGHGEFLLVAFSPHLGTVRVAVQLTGRPVEVEFRIDVPGTVAP